ncbi:MAG: hypothetical protein ACO3GW_11605, partial [Vulcanococcus sp.]
MWSIQVATESHQYQQQHNAAAGEWGTATIDSRGNVNYIQNAEGIRNHPANEGEITSSTTHTVLSSSGSAGAINPGGHRLTNNGAVNGKAWWKHLNQETGQEVVEQIESRHHNEFYDVFKDGVYVGTYQMSANALHITRSAYDERIPIHGASGQTKIVHTAGVDLYQLSDVHLGLLARGSAQNTGEASDAPEDEESGNEQTLEEAQDHDTQEISVEVTLDQTDQDDKKALPQPSAEEIAQALQNINTETSTEEA